MAARKVTSPIAWRAVKRTWLTRTRSVTQRPARVSRLAARKVPNAKRANPPRTESRRAPDWPMAATTAVTALPYQGQPPACKRLHSTRACV